MTQQKRIIIGGFVLNFIVYLLVAGFFSRAYYAQNQEQLGKLAMVSSKVFQARLMTEHYRIKNVLEAFYETRITLTNKILWAQPSVFQLEAILRKEDGSLKTLFANSPTPGIPKEVSQQHFFEFVQYGQNKLPYIFNALNTFKADDSLLWSHTLVFKIDLEQWQLIAKNIGFNYSLIEQSSQMQTQTIFTNLTDELAQELQMATTYINSDLTDQIQAEFLLNTHSRFAKMFSFSGTKTILYPVVIANTKNIHQVLFISFPLENYREVEPIAILLLVLALFCVSAGTFVLGFS